MDLRAVDRDDPDTHHPRLRAQLQHLPEQLAQRPLVPDPEPRDRRVIGRLVGGDHPERDILADSAARSAATSAPRSRTRTRSTPPSSPDHAPPGHDRRHDRRQRTRPNRARRPRRSQTTRSDPRPTTRAGSAATTTPARDHTPGSSAACMDRLNPPGRTHLCATATMDRSSGGARRLATPARRTRQRACR